MIMEGYDGIIKKVSHSSDKIVNEYVFLLIMKVYCGLFQTKST